jgi:heme/copper-type cytochrome/quinol oxidase subunit 4
MNELHMYNTSCKTTTYVTLFTYVVTRLFVVSSLSCFAVNKRHVMLDLMLDLEVRGILRC